jgi:hypothetical protein
MDTGELTQLHTASQPRRLQLDSLRVFENEILRRICGPKEEKMVGGWRRLHNEKLHNLYTSPNVIDDQINETGMSSSTHWKDEKCKQYFGQKT